MLYVSVSCTRVQCTLCAERANRERSFDASCCVGRYRANTMQSNDGHKQKWLQVRKMSLLVIIIVVRRLLRCFLFCFIYCMCVLFFAFSVRYALDCARSTVSVCPCECARAQRTILISVPTHAVNDSVVVCKHKHQNRFEIELEAT